MGIKRVLSTQTSGSYFCEDITRLHEFPTAVEDRYQAGLREPGEALSIGLVLGDGRVAWGDCVGVSYAGKAGRDPVFRAAEGRRAVESLGLIGSLPNFRSYCETLRTSGLHTAVRYGVSQALLSAHASAANVTACEIVCRDWSLPIPTTPIGILGQSANLKDTADRMIARRVASLPHGLVDNPPEQVGASGETLIEYARWLSHRIAQLGGPDYRPTIHLDVHGALAGFPIELTLALEKAAAPYPLRLESPFLMSDRGSQIAAIRAFTAALAERGSRVEIVSDELTNTREDILEFARARAGHMVQVKMPDLGGIDESIDTVLGCREYAMKTLLGGSCNETDLSARLSAQVALAVRPDLVLGKPGMGVDEGIALVSNEMARTLAELGIAMDGWADNREALVRSRLAKLQKSMRGHGWDACLFTNPMHIRFATGTSVMPVWTALNLARYALVPAEGDPIVFEYGKSLFRTQALWKNARPATAWQQRFSQHEVDLVSRRWAEEIASFRLKRILVDPLDVNGFRALERVGLELGDADEVLDEAKLVKSPEEIEWLRRACRVAESALLAMEKAVAPGISENELFGIFHERMIALGGELCSTRLIASGPRINPWFREASDRRLLNGDLVGIDTDMTGEEGYLCDISRTFLCGDHASDDRRDAYRVARDFIEEMIPLCRPGTSHATLVDKAPRYPEEYTEQGYSCMLHGAGFDDEPPFLPFPHEGGAMVPRGELRPGMVLCVEFYAGKKGKKDGVKLEEQILVTDGAPERLSRYPYETRLL